MNAVIPEIRPNDLMNRLSSVEKKLKVLCATVSEHSSSIADLSEEVDCTRDRIDDVSDLITGKMDGYSGVMDDDRNTYRRYKDREYEEYKYVFGGIQLYEDEDGVLQQESYLMSDSVVEEDLQVLEYTVRNNHRIVQERIERCENKLDTCLKIVSEYKTEVDLLMEMFSAMFAPNFPSRFNSVFASARKQSCP